MAGNCATAIAISAQTVTSTNSAIAPINFRSRTGMANPVLREQGGALYGPRANDKNMTTVIAALYRDEFDHCRAIRLWLYAVAALVFVMVLVGGATRLTESGLSITEWQPLTGVVPPLNELQWQSEFQKYQAIPQYRQLNAGMSLGDFKTIYWWEWAHRFIGRAIGVVFLVPFVGFLWRGWIPSRRRAALWMILALGGLQGAIGWWMVASGLADRVEVSQYRLATHLVLACLVYVALVWTSVRWEDERAKPLIGEPGIGAQTTSIRAGAIGLVVLVLAQIYLGALVAGLRAGHAYNTWPLIDGRFIPQSSSLLFQVPLWRNFFENPLTVQFDHRVLGYIICLVAIVHLFNVIKVHKRGPIVTAAALVAAAIIVQAALGILTLLSIAALPLALLHQAAAMMALTFVVIHAANANPRKTKVARLSSL
jgi:cytochrome c oxidase assembly protein subunit 15